MSKETNNGKKFQLEKVNKGIFNKKSGNEKKGRLVTFVSSVSRRFWLIRHKKNAKKSKNFLVRALKTKRNVFSLHGSQDNPTLVKYSNGGR